jgi:hypothetical protein
MEHYIYKINHISGKTYIGQTIDIDERFLYHKRKIKYKKHNNSLLNEDCDIQNYNFTIIDKTNNQEDADILEKYYINIFNSYYKDGGFNLTPGGKGIIERKGKEVYLFNLNGNFIRKYSSIRDCARDLGFDASNIYRNCIGEYSKYNGYIFSFTSEIIIKKKSVDNRMTKVSKYDENGKFIESYDTLKDAAIKNKIHHTASISNAIKNKTFTYGYYWRYYTDNSDIILTNKRCYVKPIKLFKNDIFIGVFDNQKKVAQYIGGITPNVNHCLNGRLKTYKGYTFKYN